MNSTTKVTDQVNLTDNDIVDNDSTTAEKGSVNGEVETKTVYAQTDHLDELNELEQDNTTKDDPVEDEDNDVSENVSDNTTKNKSADNFDLEKYTNGWVTPNRLKVGLTLVLTSFVLGFGVKKFMTRK